MAAGGKAPAAVMAVTKASNITRVLVIVVFIFLKQRKSGIRSGFSRIPNIVEPDKEMINSLLVGHKRRV
jgi:hypothetical protein